MFPDDDTAGAWIASKRWPDGPRCPHCDSDNVLTGAAHKTMPYRCRTKNCRTPRFSVRVGTVLHDSKLGYQTWALAIYLMTTELTGRSSMKLHRDLGIAQKSAWHIDHRIREAYDLAQGQYDGTVEVDETYIGGTEKTTRLNAGRSTVGKAAVVGVRGRATRKVAASVVPATDARTLRGFVSNRASDGAKVYTDGAKVYQGIPNHHPVRHSVGEYVRDQVHTNGMEPFWSMLKRGYYGTYHRMSVNHVQRYVTEFRGRYNVRAFDTIDQVTAVVVGVVGKRIHYQDLTVSTSGWAT